MQSLNLGLVVMQNLVAAGLTPLIILADSLEKNPQHNRLVIIHKLQSCALVP